MSCDLDGTHAGHFVTSDLVQTVFQTNKMRAELPSSQPLFRQAGSAGLCQTLERPEHLQPQAGGPFQNLDASKQLWLKKEFCK